MALCFYFTINVIATFLVVNNDIEGIDASSLMVFEVLLIWTNKYVSFILSLLFALLALFNIPFSIFIGFEQVMLLLKEIFSKSESIRVEKYLKLKYRTIKTIFTDGSPLVPQLER